MSIRTSRFAAFAALICGTCLAPNSAMAGLVTLTPASVSASSGEPVIVNIQVSDLGAGNVLGAFDLNVSYNPALFLLGSVVFGKSLGDPLLFEALTTFSVAPGVINLAEVSLLSPAQLDAAQGDTFSIAMLTFAGIAPGTATFSLLDTSRLIDGFGVPLTLSTPTAVPEPGSLFLVVLALAAMTRPFRSRVKHATVPMSAG